MMDRACLDSGIPGWMTVCLRTAGAGHFAQALFSSLNESIAIDHLLLVETGSNGTMLWGACSRTGRAMDTSIESTDCARRFVGAAIHGGPEVILLPPDKRSVGCGTANPSVVDRLCLVFRGEDATIVLGLYRCDDSPRFVEAERHAVAVLADMLAALADIHIRLSISRSVPRHLERAWNGTLSERERAVARLFARGETVRTIADLLGVAPTSVVTYKKRAFVKLGVSRQCELAALVGALG